ARLGEPGPRAMVGTPAYLSPEQVRGEPPAPATDLYGLGALSYRALTGEVPFSDPVDEVVQAHRKREPAPLSTFDDALAPLDDLVARLLAKDVRARPDGALEVASALRAAAERWLAAPDGHAGGR